MDIFMFLSSKLGKIVATSTVLAALITAAVIFIGNHGHLRVENKRTKNEIKTFKYSELKDIYDELEDVLNTADDLPEVKDEAYYMQVVAAERDRYYKVEHIFEKARPLLDEAKIKEVVSLKTKAIRAAEQLSNHIHSDGDEATRHRLFDELRVVRLDFILAVKKAISAGIVSLKIE